MSSIRTSLSFRGGRVRIRCHPRDGAAVLVVSLTNAGWVMVWSSTRGEVFKAEFVRFESHPLPPRVSPLPSGVQRSLATGNGGGGSFPKAGSISPERSWS